MWWRFRLQRKKNNTFLNYTTLILAEYSVLVIGIKSLHTNSPIVGWSRHYSELDSLNSSTMSIDLEYLMQDLHLNKYNETISFDKC